MDYLAAKWTRKRSAWLGSFFPVTTHKFWGSENFGWTAANSSILWIILFDKIISLYQWTNQDLEISNSMTQLSKWHNQNSSTDLLEFFLIANPVSEPVSYASTCPDAMLMNLFFTCWSLKGSVTPQNRGISSLHTFFQDAAYNQPLVLHSCLYHSPAKLPACLCFL